MTVPNRRWFRFSLRTLFVVVTVVAVGAAWTAYHLNWIRQRRQYIETVYSHGPRDQPNMALWLLGEEGVAFIVIGNFSDNEDPAYARSLFPEAEVGDPKNSAPH